MQLKEDLMSELKLVESNLVSRTSGIESKVDQMEGTRTQREGDRKATFLREMKKLLLILNDVDKKVVQDIKMEAFDNIRGMNKLRDEIADLESKLLAQDDGIEAGEVVQSINTIKAKAASLEESFPTSNLSLSVGGSPHHLQFLANTIRSAVYLKTPLLDPYHYSLDCSPMFSQAAAKDSLMELRVHCTLPTRQFTQHVLTNLVLCISCPDGSHFNSRKVLEEGTMAALIKKKKAFLPTPTTLIIQVKKPKNLVVTLEVKVLETDVVNSPRVLQFLWSEQGQDTTQVQDMTRLDMTGVGQLCQADLDMTEIADTAQEDSPASPLQPTGPTPPKLCRQSSNISPSSDQSDSFTYYQDRTDPHPDLNASKAPNQTQLNASYLPDSCWNDSKWCPSPPSHSNTNAANTTLWEVPSTPTMPSIFLSSSLQFSCVYRAMEGTLSTTRTQLVCLSPYDITLYHTAGVYLVSEPYHNRVGAYSALDMQYKGLLGNGNVQFDYPTSILALTGGGLVLLDKTKMNIFSDHCMLEATFNGRFYGLTEGDNGEIFSVSPSSREMSIAKLVRGGDGKYKVNRIKLRVVKEFDNWKNLSNPKNIIYSQGKIFISDRGLHKVFVVDLVSGQQTAFGYLGEGLGQFKRPAGMVADSDGNLLVVDEGNNRVLVYTASGTFVKVAAVAPKDFHYPCGISVWGDTVMVAFMGKKFGKGGVIKYKLEV